MTQANEAELRALQAADDRRCHAMTTSDLAALDEVLSDDLVYTHSTARSDTKEQYLANIRSGKIRYRAVRREGVVVTLRGDTALMRGGLSLELDRDGQHVVADSKFLGVWAKESGGWKLLAWASTPIPKA